MEITDDIIKELFKSKRYTYNPNILRRYINRIEGKYNKDIYKYLINRYDDSDSLKETLYRIYNRIEQHPICPVCGKPLIFKGKFLKFCSNICAQSSGEIRQKIMKTCLEKYGTISTTQNKKIRDKIKNTCLEKYGVDNPAKLKENKEKVKQTCLKKYEGIAPICNHNIKNQIKQTCLEKYGVDNYGKSLKHKINMSSIMSSDKIQKHRYDVMTKNNTFNTSKSEDQVYDFLMQYTNVERQYKCSCYPFCCDFYLKDFDIFIECNFHWTHGGHPFDSNCIEDQHILQEWKSKNTKYYNNAIETWSVRDVKKRDKAIENNLNYLEFWSLKELKEYFIKFCENKNIN